MDSRQAARIALLITALVLCYETSEIKDQPEACVCNEVNLHQSHNSSERPCTDPDQPINGHYDIYKTGDTITYHCNRGYILIGQANRACNKTANTWDPQEPYCEPEYVGRLMTRLDGIEQRITTLENITSGMRDILLSSIDNKSEMDKNRSRLMVCIKKTNVIDQDIVSKCLTMQLGVRNGRSVSVFNWTVENFERNRPTESRIFSYYSEPFYHTVPGYKLRLKIYIWADYGLWPQLNFVPSDSDEQLKWPFSTPFDMTVLLNNGTEFLYKHFPGHSQHCTFKRPKVETEFDCSIKSPGWESLSKNKQHVLKDDSLVVKVYIYN